LCLSLSGGEDKRDQVKAVFPHCFLGTPDDCFGVCPHLAGASIF
jgi:hypothetical protein